MKKGKPKKRAETYEKPLKINATFDKAIKAIIKTPKIKNRSK
jgi:hypothetical protein